MKANSKIIMPIHNTSKPTAVRQAQGPKVVCALVLTSKRTKEGTVTIESLYSMRMVRASVQASARARVRRPEAASAVLYCIVFAVCIDSGVGTQTKIMPKKRKKHATTEETLQYLQQYLKKLLYSPKGTTDLNSETI